MTQISQNSNDLRDAISAINNGNQQQQQQIQQLVQHQVQQQLQHTPSTTLHRFDNEYHTNQFPPQPLLAPADDKSAEVSELKAQVATLKAALSARTAASAPSPIPSYPNIRPMNWSPMESNATIPSWQQKSASPTRNTSSPQNAVTQPNAPRTHSPSPQPIIQPLPTQQPSHTSPQQQQQQQQQPPQQQTQQQQPEHPYSTQFMDVLQLVQDKNLSKEDLHTKLGIREINDKPVGMNLLHI